jgi:hypothetical protein
VDKRNAVGAWLVDEARQTYDRLERQVAHIDNLLEKSRKQVIGFDFLGTELALATFECEQMVDRWKQLKSQRGDVFGMEFAMSRLADEAWDRLACDWWYIADNETLVVVLKDYAERKAAERAASGKAPKEVVRIPATRRR